MSNRIGWVLLTVLALGMAFNASASTITVHVDGIVTLVDDDDGLLPTHASVGDAWRITYVISSIASPNSCAEWLLSGCYYGVIESMTSTIAGESFTLLPVGEFSNYQVSGNMAYVPGDEDRWSVHAVSSDGAVLPPDILHSMDVTLFGPGDSALVVDKSYLPVPDFIFATRAVMGFGASRYFEDLSYDTGDILRGRVTRITQAVSVPEPTTFWLFGTSLVALLSFAGRGRGSVVRWRASVH